MVKKFLRVSLTFASVILTSLFACRPAAALQWMQPGDADFSKAALKVVPVRDNLSVIQIATPQSPFNVVVLAGPVGYLLVEAVVCAG